MKQLVPVSFIYPVTLIHLLVF